MTAMNDASFCIVVQFESAISCLVDEIGNDPDEVVVNTAVIRDLRTFGQTLDPKVSGITPPLVGCTMTSSAECWQGLKYASTTKLGRIHMIVELRRSLSGHQKSTIWRENLCSRL